MKLFVIFTFFLFVSANQCEKDNLCAPSNMSNDAAIFNNNCRLRKEYISILEKLYWDARSYTVFSVSAHEKDDLIMKLNKIKSQHESILRLNQDILRYAKIPDKLIRDIAADKDKAETFIMKLESALSKIKN